VELYLNPTALMTWCLIKHRYVFVLGVGEKITLSWTLGRQGSMGRTGFSWLRIVYSGGLL